MAALSPLLLRKGIQGITGDVKSVEPLVSGDLLIEVYRQQQAMNLLGTTSFAGIGVSVKPHSSLNCSKGVIRCPALRNDTDEDILVYFQEESVPVSEVRRMVIRRNNDTIKTNTFIITFSTPTLPHILTIRYQRYNVSVYIPNPLRCRNCQKYGHHEKRCRRKSICQYCGREGHTEQNDCDIANLRCVNCEGRHDASSRDCPTWSQEREILRVKYTRGVSFPEARRLVGSADIATPSYAQVTRGKAPVDSVTVKDAPVQVSEDIPAWSSQVPDMAGQQSLKILTGDPSRFTTLTKPTKSTKSNNLSKAASPSKTVSSSKPATPSKPAPPSKTPSSSGENPPKVGPSRAQMRSQRSHSLTSVPRSQLRTEVTSPTNRPREKIE
ncbi:uncharacterized protein LOC110449995 [Mizuhopecten yessoensis]|uniref:uncharacterized protein LOC110449995 n=1 Tax=Mizuhopecten yessoensis TaxID=6573 RepID=UPI000B45A50E|nr:uncharacterized protein LOC110449995 [Mizuhopecten yessoensis]